MHFFMRMKKNIFRNQAAANVQPTSASVQLIRESVQPTGVDMQLIKVNAQSIRANV